MHWRVVALELCLALLSGPLYALSRAHPAGLCTLLCGPRTFVAPCFVLPRAGCAGRRACEASD
jgi:hypothetical protein